MRRTTLALALAALLVLAGCADVEVGSSPTPEATSPATGATTDTQPPTDTTAGTATPTNVPDRGIYGDTIGDPAAVVDAHAEALRSAGSFTYRAEATFDLDSPTPEVNRTARVTDGGDVLTVATNAPTLTQRTYVDADEAYTWRDRRGSVDVNHDPGLVGDAERYFGAGLGELLAAADLEYRKETTIGGVTADLYTADAGDVDTEDRDLSYFAPDAVDGARLSVAVDANGVVRLVEYRVDATDGRSVSLRVTYRDVGSTTQPSPGWLADARDTDPGDQFVYLRGVSRSFVDRVRANHLFGLVEGSRMVERFGRFEAALASEVTYREGTSEDELSVGFDGRAVDGSTSGEYHMYRYDESTRSLVRVDASLEDDERTATVEDGYFMVLHRPTYEGERNG